MTLYNNLPQQMPYMYGYGIPNYQRGAAQAQDAQLQPPAQTPPTFVMPQPNFIKGRPVVSIDEARASQIDLDGSLYVFPDLGNKKIYTKQINMDGTASFNVFELAEPQESARQPVYVTKDELDEILSNFKASLVQKSPPEPSPAPKPHFNL